ncbi:MAG: GNAT family N-acetyltransferase [Arthrobacter sp.]|jgi:RimJ/RimL family protein N-acetyltransferase|nr:GNAT family N-acetyltransferase [Arthrobacter sp.]
MSERTEHLVLTPTAPGDLEEIHALYSDPRVWTHLPSGRFTDLEATREWLAGRVRGRDVFGIGSYTARDPETGALLGHGGCEVRGSEYAGGDFINLGYRFAPEAQGRGLATELARFAMKEAALRRPDLPIVAYLLEHNAASAAVAGKLGMTLRHRAPDAGNPDPEAIRLVFADRELTPAQLASTLA